MDEKKVSYGNKTRLKNMRRTYDSKAWRCIFLILRIILFPIALLIRLFRWTYHYDD